MEIKALFDRALSEVSYKYTFSSDREIADNIMERAKKMEKNKKTRERVFGVVGGIAGAAAVLAGAVFGLNWLNEHGGLKEGGGKLPGAAYHGDVTAQLSADADGNSAESLASFVFDGFTVNVTDYDFDGISLSVYYDVIFADNCTLSSGEKLASVLPMAKFSVENAAEGFGELISETDNTQSCVYRTTLKAYTETLTVDFKPNEEGYAEFGGYPFTVYADHREPAAKTEVPVSFEYKESGFTANVKSYEFDGRTLILNWDTVFDLELEKYQDPQGMGIPLIQGMKDVDALSFMDEPDENIDNWFVNTNSISGKTIARTMMVVLKNNADRIDLIFAPKWNGEFDTEEYTFTATVNALNVQPIENAHKTGEGAVANLEYDTCTVVITDYTFDGLRLTMTYDYYPKDTKGGYSVMLGAPHTFVGGAMGKTDLADMSKLGHEPVPTYGVQKSFMLFSPADEIDVAFLAGMDNDEEQELITRGINGESREIVRGMTHCTLPVNTKLAAGVVGVAENTKIEQPNGRELTLGSMYIGNSVILCVYPNADGDIFDEWNDDIADMRVYLKGSYAAVDMSETPLQEPDDPYGLMNDRWSKHYLNIEGDTIYMFYFSDVEFDADDEQSIYLGGKQVCGENGGESGIVEIDADAKPVNGVVPMDETVELDDMTVHFTCYDYDSQILRIEYDVKYTDGRTNAGRNPLTIINLDKSSGGTHGALKYESGVESDILHCYTEVAINGTPDYIRVPFGYAVFPEDFPAEPYTEADELFAITVHCDPDSVIRTFWNDRVKVGETGREFKIADAFITPTHISARLKFDGQLTDELTDNITAGLRLKDGSSVELTNKTIIGYSENSSLYWLVAWYDEPTALDEIADANINGFYFSEPDEEYFEMMKAKYPDICSIEHSPLYTPADEWYDCDGKRVHVTGYTFDGVLLRLRYETCYDYPLSGAGAARYGYTLPNTLWDGLAYLCNGEADESRISEGIVSETFNIFVTTPTETLDIPFGVGIFTVHKNDTVPTVEKEIGIELSVGRGETVSLDRLVLSSGNLSISMSGSPYTNDYTSETGIAYMEALSDLETVITLKNGGSIDLSQGWNEPAGMGLSSGNGYKFYQFTDPIDINDVVSITVNGTEIYAS